MKEALKWIVDRLIALGKGKGCDIRKAGVFCTPGIALLIVSDNSASGARRSRSGNTIATGPSRCRI